MLSLKRITASPMFQGAMGTLGAWYLRLVVAHKPHGRRTGHHVTL